MKKYGSMGKINFGEITQLAEAKSHNEVYKLLEQINKRIVLEQEE